MAYGVFQRQVFQPAVFQVDTTAGVFQCAIFSEIVFQTPPDCGAVAPSANWWDRMDKVSSRHTIKIGQKTFFRGF